VPWNNNNAEHAIKRFAYYRENTVGSLEQQGLSDYLTLLSVCQTCRYKGVSFLKFLLSRDRDMDAFCEGRRRRQRQQASIELYPVGFIPPHFQHREQHKQSKMKPDPDQPKVNSGSPTLTPPVATCPSPSGDPPE